MRDNAPDDDTVSIAGANNMFGSIDRRLGAFIGNFGFVPTDGNGGTMSLNDTNVSPQWMGLESRMNQFKAYCYCPPLSSCIDRLAQADSNGIISFVDNAGLPINNINKIPSMSRIRDLFLDPNPMETWFEFDAGQVVFAKTFGFCPVWCITPAGMDRSYTIAMFNLNPYIVQAIPNFDYSMYALKGTKNANPIKEWTFTMSGITYRIPAEDVLLIKDGYMNQTVGDGTNLPMSKVAGLDYSISNICAAMEADNVLLKKKGPLGIFSYDPKPDMAGSTPMTGTDKNEIQNELKRYGMSWGQLQYIVSKMPVKWNSMSFNVQELMTKETVRQGTDSICDRFDYPAELMSGKNATYENRTSAEKFLYQNNIIPFSLRRMARYNKFFGLTTTDYNIVINYNHLAVLQEDLVKSGQARYYQSQSLLIDWQAGMITMNQYLIRQELPEVEGGDIYYPEWLKNNPLVQQQKSNKNATKKNTPKD